MPRRDLTLEESQLIESINKGDIEKAKSLLSLPTVQVDSIDKDGMTPLMHASYKGNAILIDELIIRGADPNSNEHDMGYTALMFAGLSGSIDSVQRLLRAGAKTYVTNSVGRTASQMAAFVGNHRIVTIINNFLEKSEVAHYSKPDGPKGEIRLPPEAVNPLHDLVISVNLSPIKMCSLVQSQPSLLNNLEKVVRVLDSICSNNFTPGKANEVLSIKTHLISVVLKRAHRNRVQLENPKGLEAFIKLLLNGIPPMGIPEGSERLLRQCLKEYPYVQSQLFQQIARDVSKYPVGQVPTALEVINSYLNGQQFFRDEKGGANCAACNDLGAVKKCSKCSAVCYCNQDCQKMHWFTHKKFCDTLKKIRLDQEEELAKQAVLDEERRQEESQNETQDVQLQHESHSEIEESPSDDSKCQTNLSQKLDEVSLSPKCIPCEKGDSEIINDS